METGIGGINIIQEMLLGYEGLILVDAFEERLPPGTLRVLEPVVEDLALNSQQQRDYFADTHYATPTRVLQFLKNIGKLPPYLRVLACEPSSIEPCTLKLSDAVSQAIPKGIQLLLRRLEIIFINKNQEQYEDCDRWQGWLWQNHTRWNFGKNVSQSSGENL